MQNTIKIGSELKNSSLLKALFHAGFHAFALTLCQTVSNSSIKIEFSQFRSFALATGMRQKTIILRQSVTVCKLTLPIKSTGYNENTLTLPIDSRFPHPLNNLPNTVK